MKQKVNIFLDDIRTPITVLRESNITLYGTLDWVVVRNYNDFINEVWKNKDNIGVISLDHDLADEHMKFYFDNGGASKPPDPKYANFKEKTGYDCAKFLVDKEIKFDLHLVHSYNPVGRKNIQCLLDNWIKFKQNERTR